LLLIPVQLDLRSHCLHQTTLQLGDDYADADDDPADDDGGLRAKPIPDPSADHSDCSNDGGVDDPAAGYHFPHDPSAANPS